MFEGFRLNGLQIRIQRIILHRIAPVNIDFDGFCVYFLFVVISFVIKTLKTHHN